MTDLVVGATGPIGLGREICRRLVAHGRSVRALVRPTSNPAAVAELRELGVELATADLKDHASLDPLCEGVENVLTTATTTVTRQSGDGIASVDLAGYHNLVYAAQRAGINHFVYTSYSINTQRASPCPLTWAKQAIERLLASSGLTYTVLRPSYFTEIWLSPMLGFDIDGAKAHIYGTGEQPISWIATGDVAEFAVRSLEHPDAKNAILELGGPEALSPMSVVRMCEELGGRSFEVELVEAATLEAQRKAAFAEANALAESLAALSLGYAAGDPIDMSELAPRFDMELRSVKDHLRAIFAAKA